MLTCRLLPPDEWPRLIEAGFEPFATYGLPEHPDHWRMIVAEADGQIVGLSSLRNEILNDWNIHPDARYSPSLIVGLWQATKAVLDAEGIDRLHATVSELQPEVQVMIQRLGYVPAAGKLFLLHVPDAVLNPR